MTKRKKAAGIFFPILILFFSLLFPAACQSGVKKGLELTLESALPSLFPALVLSRMITGALPGVKGRKALFLPLVLGLVCGFPIGATVAASLAEKGCISRREGEVFLFFCNNAGPAFLVNLCGEMLFGNGVFGWYLFFLQAAAAFFFFFFFFGKRRSKTKEEQNTAPSPSFSFSSLITDALSGAAGSFLYISACIIFFSFLSELVSSLFSLPPLLASLVSLFLELTGGIASLRSLPVKIAFPLCAAGIGWSGLSVQFQTLGITNKAGFSPKYFFAGRITFSLILFLAAKILQKCL